MEFVSFDGGRSIDLKLFENKNKACKKVLKESTNKLDSLLLNYLLQLPSQLQLTVHHTLIYIVSYHIHKKKKKVVTNFLLIVYI